MFSQGGAQKRLLADTDRLLESGEPATLSVDAPRSPETSPAFTVKSGQEVAIDPSSDCKSLLHERSGSAVP